VGRVCVTGSVAVGSEQHGEDATGHNSIIGHIRRHVRTYRENRELDKRPKQFFKSTTTLVWKTSAVGFRLLGASVPGFQMPRANRPIA
jgi:hypothetical protein